MKRSISIMMTFIMLLICLTACSKQNKPDAANPVTLTMWHVYGSQTESPLNTIIDEFNLTVGKENGVIINVVSVTSSSAIDKALAASSKNEPGAEALPDLFTAYPRVAEIVGTENLLEWDNYFTPDELSQFTSEFLTEGYFDDKLLMLPIAKSTEALFLNETIFKRFQNETNVSIEELSSFESLFRVAEKYYDWSNGQHFMQINDYYNYAYIGMKAYQSEFIVNDQLQLDTPAFATIWHPLAHAAIHGGICLEDGYAAARWKTIEIIANTGSTADILYQPDRVIYPDNTTESISTLALPYPTFTDTSNYTVHRGGGLFAIKNEDERKNYGAYIFAKWLSQKDHNLSFVTQAGYLPVTDEAFEDLFANITLVENKDYHTLYTAIGTMNKNYTFFALPLFRNASEVQLNFEQNVKTILKTAHNQYLQRIAKGEDPSAVIDELIVSSLEELKELTTY